MAAKLVQEVWYCTRLTFRGQPSRRFFGGIMNWIKCSERLPEDGLTVLLYERPDELWFGYFDGEPEAIVFFGAGSKRKNITHWMPLPEPPKE